MEETQTHREDKRKKTNVIQARFVVSDELKDRQEEALTGSLS